jgi:hypothetical protein
VNAEFIVWALVVGLVLGAGLVWLVIMDSRRRELDVEAVERPLEAAWLSAVMAEDGFDVSPEAAERLLDLHRVYLEAPPPDQAAAIDDGYDDGPGAAADELAVDTFPVDDPDHPSLSES